MYSHFKMLYLQIRKSMQLSFFLEMELNIDFVNRTESLFGKEIYSRFVQALDREPVVSIRYNGPKMAADSSLKPVPWATQGRYLPSRPVFTADPLFRVSPQQPRLQVGMRSNKKTDNRSCPFQQDTTSKFLTALQRTTRVLLDL